MTKEERKAEDERYKLKHDYIEWKIAMCDLDDKMPRYLEDVISVLTPEQWKALPKIVKDNYNAKRKLREKRPEKNAPQPSLLDKLNPFKQV